MFAGVGGGALSVIVNAPVVDVTVFVVFASVSSLAVVCDNADVVR